MRSSGFPSKGNLMDVPKGKIRLRQISKIKQYDAIDKKYVRERGSFSDKKTSREQDSLKVKKIAKQKDADDNR